MGKQALVLLVGHGVDMAAQRLASGRRERRLQEPTVLGLFHVPTGVPEELHQLLSFHLRHHPVQALTVDVHNPHDVGQPLEGRIGDGFPYVALIKFGVTHEGYETTGTRWRKVVVDIAAGGGGKQGSDGAQPHRTGGEVGNVRVLGTAGVGL